MTTKKRGQLCPLCEEKGSGVSALTLTSLLTDEARARLSSTAEGYSFCRNAGCDVSYYGADTFMTADVRVAIFQKSCDPKRPVCYCFGHSVEDIEKEVKETGTSTIPAAIRDACRKGLDNCKKNNPQGSCCLGNVSRILKAARTSAVVESSREGGVLLRINRRPMKNRTSIWATGGALVTAVLSSACCWLPLLLVAFGVSTAGVGSFVETYRPYLLGATALLIAVAFYLVYFRKQTCEEGDCAAPRPGFEKINRILLWCTAVIVLVFAFFPNLVGTLLGTPSAQSGIIDKTGLTEFVVELEGMTCEACAIPIGKNIQELAGVRFAEVIYTKQTRLQW